MENEWAEVVNNLIKIGLPSLVTGVVTVLGVKNNAKATHDKFFIEHKTKVLEKVSDEVDEYFDSWEMVYSKIGAILKQKEHDLDEVKLTDSQIKVIVQRDKELIVNWSKKKSSLSKLRLLGADEAVMRLEDCAQLEKQLRDLMFFDKKYPNYNRLTEMRKEARTAQEKFHSALSKFYGRLSS